jgi:outer membrane protein OmpA-like peptidoglycan-associated protein/tetratricopeptide (TPR) repeat protein
MRFLLLALFPFVLFAQNNDADAKKPKTIKYPKASTGKKTRIAKAKVKDGSYYNAADYLAQVVAAKPEKIKNVHQLANVEYSLRDYSKAEKYFKMVIDKDPGKYAEDQFYYGKSLKVNGKYEEAKTQFQNFLKSKDSEDLGALRSMAKVEITGCDSAIALIANPTKFKVVRENGVVNKPIQDYSPKPLSGNRILYATLKSDTAVNITDAKYDYYSSIFTAEKVNGTWQNAHVLPTPPNDPKTHVGNAIMSADEKSIIFTKCDEHLIKTMLCKLYQSKKEGAEWSVPEELKSLNAAGEGKTTTQPAYGVDKDGKPILYFVSNRSGKGGLDIFYATVNTDGTFGPATNVGAEINTAGDDVTPYYNAATKTFYFSSDGHPSLGGLDVFKTFGTPGNFTPVSNMGVPTNTGADDLYLALDEKGAKGFLVSNRVGSLSQRGETCCDDIYGVVLRGDVFLKGLFVKRNDPTNTPVEGVDASLYKVDGKNFEFQTNTVTASTPFVFPIKRATSYKLNGTKEGFWPSIDNFTVSEDEERDTIFQIFYIDPVLKKKLRIENIYFQFDKSNVLTFYKQKIDSVYGLLVQNPGWLVEVQGHTDSKGTDQYNEALSKRRAEEAAKQLVKLGIAKERIVVKTFGEKVPAAANEMPDGTDDPEARARNRRVEFKIIVDKPDDAPEFEYSGEVIPEVKTGPGFTTKSKPNKK